MIENFILLFQTSFYLKIWQVIIGIWPIWLPIFFISLFINVWINYKRRDYINTQKKVLLEIKLPKDIVKTPAAMELMLNGIFEPSVGNLSEVFFKGRVRDWFSLEIVSIGGEVKFFIWALDKWKNTIESRIYAQYPGAEVLEAKEDYASNVIFDLERMNLWGMTTSLVKKDAYPIKTYIDYELDKNVKEQEEIVDPLTPLIEFMGSLKEGEQAWIQILIQAHRSEGLQDARIFSKPDWKEGVKSAIKNIIEKESFVKPSKPQKSNSEQGPSFLTFLTRTQDKTIEAIERNVGKLAYDSMIRVIYIASTIEEGIENKSAWNSNRITGLVGSFRQFGSQNLNGIRPKWLTGTDYPWADFFGTKKIEGQRTLLDAYKRRSFFNVPYKHLNGKPYILTTEELATIFHFPGVTASTPTLTRVPSKKAPAPTNLPM